MKRPLILAAILAGVALILAAGATTTVLHLEEQDTFCVSCHTAPEITYYNRAQAAIVGQWPFIDLSSAHYAASVASQATNPTTTAFACIDCHRGDDSPTHRILTLTLGGRDALIWLTGQDDPTIEKGPDTAIVPHLLNAACIDCHTDALLTVGFDNHFHNYLPTAYQLWQQGGALIIPTGVELPPDALTSGLPDHPVDLNCLSCHSAHTAAPHIDDYLDIDNRVYPACEACHIETGLGPLGLAEDNE